MTPPKPDPEAVEKYRQLIRDRTKDFRGLMKDIKTFGWIQGMTAAGIWSAADRHCNQCIGCDACQELRDLTAWCLAYELELAPDEQLELTRERWLGDE